VSVAVLVFRVVIRFSDLYCCVLFLFCFFFFFQAEDGIRVFHVTGVSDVCSSDLRPSRDRERAARDNRLGFNDCGGGGSKSVQSRSEERRVGKECRGRWWTSRWKREKRCEGRGWCGVKTKGDRDINT